MVMGLMNVFMCFNMQLALVLFPSPDAIRYMLNKQHSNRLPYYY